MSALLPGDLVRPARPEDAPMMAAVEMLTAPEFARFVFEDLIPGLSAGALMSSLYAGDGPDGWSRSWIAESEGETAGALTAYPARLAGEVSPTDPAAERLAHLAGFSAIAPKDALHVPRLGILPGFRGRGLARGLLEAAFEAAERESLAGVSLFVWSDNAPARALYASMGFRQAGSVEIGPHPRLARHGESLLMIRPARALP